MRRSILSAQSIAIIIALFFLALTASAQYIKLHDFGAQPEGITPYAPLVTDGTFLYGITASGTDNNSGAIYKYNPADGKVTVLHIFDETQGNGAYGKLLYDGGAFYGTALTGGANGLGYIYKINPDGTGFTNLFDFSGTASGAYPYAGLITDGSVFYGVTTQGGTKFYGVVFQIDKDGSNYKTIYEFDYTNGGLPEGDLVYDGNYLYGTTSQGGTNFVGTIFKIKPDATGFTTILNFDGAAHGSTPNNGLYNDGTFLWGMTQFGGTSNKGALFRILPDGTGYTKFIDFNGGTIGDNPKSTLISDGTFLYGTTAFNGALATGTVFKIKNDGTGISKVVDLDNGPFGQIPEGTLTLMGSTLYGTRSSSGHSSRGEIFQVDTNGSNYQVSHSFSQEGNNPSGDLISDGVYLYGVNERGGEYDNGTIYRVKPDGSGFETIVNFDGPAMGSRPLGSVLRNGTKLFGLTSSGGSTGKGTLYFVDTDGANFTKLVDFDGPTRGEAPYGGLIFDGTYLYGMTSSGGANSVGVIFRIMPNGTNFSVLRDFAGGTTDGSVGYNNLLLEGGVLYGMTYSGGSGAYGVVFKMNTDGSGFQLLHSFNYDDGAYPNGSVYSDGTFLYGLTSGGGDNGQGSVFKIKKDGSGFQKLIDLSDAIGVSPLGSFVSDGTHLYAVTSSGGVVGYGTMLKIAFDGTFTKMMDFADGSNPRGSLFSDGTFLYGITQSGGAYTFGTLYKRSLAPAATIVTFDPQRGTAGTYVTIVGNDFDPVATNNIVKFNGVTATVLTAKADSLVVLVPEGATPGPISVAANSTTDVSILHFDVTADADMDNGKVRTCNTVFTGANGDREYLMTFEPATPGAKLTVDFTDMTIDDYLEIYDGPDMSKDPVATLGPGDDSFTYTSTALHGELTFHWIWEDEDSDWTANITCGPVSLKIDTQPSNAGVCLSEIATFTTSASGPNKITYQWQSSPDGNTFTNLADGGDFAGANTSALTITASKVSDEGSYRCNIKGDDGSELNTDVVTLTVNNCGGTDLVVYNAVSPNNDGKNDFFFIENIDVIASKKENTVKIFNRWGDEVFAVANYNNKERLFNGTNKNGNKLPSGTYFYKISFTQDKEITGYLELKY